MFAYLSHCGIGNFPQFKNSAISAFNCNKWHSYTEDQTLGEGFTNNNIVVSQRVMVMNTLYPQLESPDLDKISVLQQFSDVCPNLYKQWFTYIYKVK